MSGAVILTDTNEKMIKLNGKSYSFSDLNNTSIDAERRLYVNENIGGPIEQYNNQDVNILYVGQFFMMNPETGLGEKTLVVLGEYDPGDEESIAENGYAMVLYPEEYKPEELDENMCPVKP